MSHEIGITEKIEEMIVGKDIDTIIPKAIIVIEEPLVNKITIIGQGKELNIISCHTDSTRELEINLSENTVLNISIVLDFSKEKNENIIVTYQDYTCNFCVANLIQKIILNTSVYQLDIKKFKALVEAPVNQDAREKYFKEYASDNKYDLSNKEESNKKLIEYFINDLFPTFILIPLIGQKSLNLANTSEMYCDLTIYSSNYAAEIIGDNFPSTTNIDFVE